MKDDAKKLKVVLLPYDDVDIDKLLQELQDCPESFITRYEVKGEKYIQINNFLDHQHPHIKELESNIPAPGKPGKTGARTRQARVQPVGREGKGKEGDIGREGKEPPPESDKGREGKGKEGDIGREGKEPPPESDKKVYGEFQNVLLTDKEFQKLVEKFGEPETLRLVERMSTGIASKGYKYSSHYATALNWERREPQGKFLPGGGQQSKPSSMDKTLSALDEARLLVEGRERQKALGGGDGL